MEKELRTIFVERFLGLVGISVILLLFPGFVIGQEAKSQPEQKFQGFNLQGYTDDGHKEWDVNGDTADIEGSKIKLSNVDANTYGEEQMNIKAQIGIIDQTSGEMHLEKDVVITTERGTKLLTDSLDWDREEDLVTTEDDVLIIDENFIVTGKGMSARPGLKTAQVKKDVTVKIDMNTEENNEDENPPLTITSDGPMVIDQAKHVATFDDNVVAVQADQTLNADRMEVYFNEEMNAIHKLICIGNVVIQQGENKSFADRAVYDAKANKVTLTGRPKLIILTGGNNAISAFGN